jgi:hypothetical protein
MIPSLGTIPLIISAARRAPDDMVSIFNNCAGAEN